MTQETADRVRPRALITGGHRRVGREISRRLAEAGCDRVLTYHRHEQDAHETASALSGLGAEVRIENVDLADFEQVESLGRDLTARAPPLDIIVHNASAYRPTPLAGVDGPTAERFLRVNALAPLLLSKHLAPVLVRSELKGGGAIVCMLDIHAIGEHSIPRRGFAPYAMSKAALAEMVRSLARELAPEVRVNGVAPGVVQWPESGYESDEAAQRAYLEDVPLARAGSARDAAEAVAWLALHAHYTTGQIIRVDGGRSLV